MFQNHKRRKYNVFYVNASGIVSCVNYTVIKISVLKGILKTTWKKTTKFLCKWVWDCNLRNKDFCLKWHFKKHKRGKHKFELGTWLEPKTGKRGKISRKGGSDQIPLFYVCSPILFACQNHPEVLKHVLQKWEVDI